MKRNSMSFLVIAIFAAQVVAMSSSTAMANVVTAVGKGVTEAGRLLKTAAMGGSCVAAGAGRETLEIAINNTDDIVKAAAKTMPEAVERSDSVFKKAVGAVMTPKVIVAGGVAAGTVVGSYELSKGHREASLAAAQADPSTMAEGPLAFITRPAEGALDLALYGGSVIFLLWLAFGLVRFVKRKTKDEY